MEKLCLQWGDFYDIITNYPITILDTCALQRATTNKKKNNEKACISVFKDFLTEDIPFYITPEVLDELKQGNHDTSLIKLLEQKKSTLLLKPEEKEIHKEFSRKYDVLLHSGQRSYTDYNLLITGLTLFYTRKKPVAIISNDIKHVASGHRVILNNEDSLTLNKLGHFFRQDLNSFRRHISGAEYPN